MSNQTKQIIREWMWNTPKGEERKMVLEVDGGTPWLWLVKPRRKNVGGAGSKVQDIPPAIRRKLGVPADWAALRSGLVAPRHILEEAVAEIARILRERREARERKMREREEAIRRAYERLPEKAKRLLEKAGRLSREAGEWARDPEGDGVARAISTQAAQVRRQAQAICPHEVMDEYQGAVSHTYAEVEPGRFAEVKRVTVTRTCPVCGYSESRVEKYVVREVTRDEYLNWLMH